MKFFIHALAWAGLADAFIQPAPRAFLGKDLGFSSKLNVAEKTAEDVATDQVKFTVDSHTLTYVDGVEQIVTGPITSENVTAFQLTNNKGVTIKAMSRGANMVVLDIGGTNYVWENKEGACYYGGWTDDVKPDAFPLKRGLILNGGIRFAAVTAEHGIYYDTEWDVDAPEVGAESDELSVSFTVVDTYEKRISASEHEPPHHPSAAKGLQQGQFNRGDVPTVPPDSETFDPVDNTLTKYPVTNMQFSYKITLRKDEDFARLRMSVKNTGTETQKAEAWLPMTFPITTESIILDKQEKRWRRDEWCFGDLPNVLNWGGYGASHEPNYHIPLAWPSSGIFYDFPSKTGNYHGVTTDPVAGKGVVYYTPEGEGAGSHYTKMWSWGDPTKFNRDEQLENLKSDDYGTRVGAALAVGRPVSEYYEPWSSGTNFAFFQTSEFPGMTETSWEVAILPISEGLTSKNKDELLGVVDGHIAGRQAALNDLEGVKVTSLT